MRKSHGFTLLELMITIVVIGILAAIVLAGVGRAYQSASAAQTKSTILKLHQIITQRWESFRYRRIPAGTERGHRDPNTNEFIQLQLDPNEAASYRLKIKRKLMRMELPDRWSDISAVETGFSSLPVQGVKFRRIDNPQVVVPIDVHVPAPAIYSAYQNYFNTVSITPTENLRKPTVHYEAAECLYMIVKIGGVDEDDSFAHFQEVEKGDVDNDGAPEFLDGWGMPIQFLRWPVGFVDDPRHDSESPYYFGHLSDIQPPKQPGEVQEPLEACKCDAANHHDPFDPRHADTEAYTIFPLIYSGGPDRKYDIYAGLSDLPDNQVDDPFHGLRNDGEPCGPYAPTLPFNPFVQMATTPKLIGMPRDVQNEPWPFPNSGYGWRADNAKLEHYDNIHNHAIETNLR